MKSDVADKYVLLMLMLIHGGLLLNGSYNASSYVTIKEPEEFVVVGHQECTESATTLELRYSTAT